jgi:Ca2+/Na+ antiporter
MDKNTKIDQKIRSKFSPINDKPIFKWQSPDHEVYKKSVSWYIALIAITLFLSFALYLQHLYSGMVLLIIAAATFVFFSQTKPKDIKSAIFQEGIVVDEKVFKFSEFKSFWITYVGIPKARLQLSGIVAGQVVMPLLNIDPEQVRVYLAKHLPEDEGRGEDLIDIVNRLLRF